MNRSWLITSFDSNVVSDFTGCLVFGGTMSLDAMSSRLASIVDDLPLLVSALSMLKNEADVAAELTKKTLTGSSQHLARQAANCAADCGVALDEAMIEILACRRFIKNFLDNVESVMFDGR